MVKHLLGSLLETPTGLTYIVTAVASFLGLVYMFLNRGTQTKQASKKPRRNVVNTPSKAQTPNKSKSTHSDKANRSKSSPGKDKSLKLDSSNGNEDSDIKANNKKSSPKRVASDKKGSKPVAAAINDKKKPANKQKQATENRPQNQQQSKNNQEDGEWITVAKKKARSPLGKKTNADEQSPTLSSGGPQLRKSTRRINQASK